MKAYTLFILVLLTVAGYSQNTLNSYKYVLVPEKFDFSREDNQYGLNVTTKLLLEKKGFTVFMGNEALPPAVAANKCNALKAEAVEKKSFFSTGITLLLKDCQGNIVFKSKEGKSREKEFPVAYDQALRDAFASLDGAPYKYDSSLLAQPQQAAATPIALPAVPAPASTAPTIDDITGTLYAQAIPAGYQLVNTTSKKVLTLFKTSVQDYFIAEAGVFNGIVFKKDNAWYFEYYKDGSLVSRKLDVKF